MLVHDDLIDGSVVRRDRATLHEAIRLDADRPDDPAGRKRAGDLGLVAGDLLFALGMRLLARSGLDDAAMGRAHRLVADMLFETGLGEALDVLYDDCPLDDLTEEQVVESYLRKTARYSVSGPLVLGAKIAGAPSATTRALDRFGDLLGFGFQVQNDLGALDEGPEYGDHPRPRRRQADLRPPIGLSPAPPRPAVAGSPRRWGRRSRSTGVGGSST